jgi:hypothetical protein
MGSRVGHIRQQLGLALAMAVCGLLSGAVSGSAADPVVVRAPQAEFILARLAYSDGGGFSRGRGDSWTTDAPDAEYHLTQGIRRLTRINTPDPEGRYPLCQYFPVCYVRPGGPALPGELDIFDYPFVYGVEVGRWDLSEEEAQNMREYLLRGGFLMVDDFHGSAQWEGFMYSMQRIFPDREVVDIPEDHEVFHVLYDLDQKQQIPGIFALMSGQSHEQDGVDPKWRGVFDDNGRLMVAINFNMDLGDAWEHADDAEYPQPLTALAYRFAISYAIYAMSH